MKKLTLSLIAVLLLVSTIVADEPPPNYDHFAHLPIISRSESVRDVGWILALHRGVMQQGEAEPIAVVVDNAHGISEWKLVAVAYPWETTVHVSYTDPPLLPDATNHPLVEVIGDDWSQGWRARQTGSPYDDDVGVVAVVTIRPEVATAEKIIEIRCNGDTNLSNPVAFSTEVCVQDCIGDHNHDGLRDLQDVMMVIRLMEDGGYYLCYDENGDGVLTQEDVDYWTWLWGLPCAYPSWEAWEASLS